MILFYFIFYFYFVLLVILIYESFLVNKESGVSAGESGG